MPTAHAGTPAPPPPPARNAGARRSAAPVPARSSRSRPTSTRADIDTAGGVITQVALQQAPRHRGRVASRISLLQRNAERTFVAQSGLLGEGMPNHRTL